MIKTELFRGDITQLELDALVNAANNHLWMGAGVAGAIKRAGGSQIEAEAMSKGPVAIGEAVVTDAGNLKAKYIIHATVMGLDLTTDAEKIRQATRNSLLRSEELGLGSIAFPAEECARIMIGEVLGYSSGKTGLKRVVFTLFDERSYRVFERELARQTKPA